MADQPTPPERLRWIIDAQHVEAWTRAANWLHANSHIDDTFVTRRVPGEPCDDCWRAAVFATKGVVLSGYQHRNRVLTEGAELIHAHRGDVSDDSPWWDTRDRDTAANVLLAARTAQ